MAMVFENPLLPRRLRRLDGQYPLPVSVLQSCDCTSYSYLTLSIVLFTIGTAITIFALGDIADGHMLSNLGHMWLSGPIFICSGLIVAVKCKLYLRRKMDMQRHFWFLLMADAQRAGGSAATSPEPPSYEVVVQGLSSNELPPPSYTEAITVLQQTTANDAKSTSIENAAVLSASMDAAAKYQA